MTYGREEAPHLSLAALPDPHAQPGPLLSRVARDLSRWRRRFHAHHARNAIVQLDAVAQPFQGRWGWAGVYQCGVLALEAVPWVKDAVGPTAVVGQQHQALRLHVQAAGGPQADAIGQCFRADQAHHGASTTLVASRGEQPTRLVDRDVDHRSGTFQWPPVDADVIHRRVRAHSKGGGCSVDRDTPRDHQLFRPAT